MEPLASPVVGRAWETLMPDDTLRLADASGGYQELRPAAALDAHFQCTWSNAPARDRDHRLAVVPDGCVDIVWIDGELTVAGPDVSVAISSVTRDGTVVGIRFRPGAAQTWLGLPMSEIVDSRVALDTFWGARARELARMIGDAATIPARMRSLETALSRMASGLAPPPPDMGFLFNTLKTGSAGPGMAIILDRLDVSPRTLRRRCEAAFGYGPKTLDRILRFQRFLRLARQEEAPRLATLAFAAGYADQAHLTREVRRLSGFSPAVLLSQL
jgi:AraC-like DNA-binding protein